jgi:GNAT superfamily N-acetyltransferase
MHSSPKPNQVELRPARDADEVEVRPARDSDQVELRSARDSDAAGLIALIGGVYAEYPNCILDVDTEERDLLAIATAFAQKPGAIWVAEHFGVVIASSGVVFHGSGAAPKAELKKVYVRRDWRRRGVASRLCDLAEGAARKRGATEIVAWSDSRFVEAHHFYERRGYERDGQSRHLHDLSATLEFHFVKALASEPQLTQMPETSWRVSRGT